MARARIFEDGTAYFGPEDEIEVKEKKEKPRSEWTEADRKTFDQLTDAVRRLVEEGKDFYDVRVKSERRNYDTELNYRKRGDNDSSWKKKIVRNQTQTEISELEAGTEYELRIRHRFIREDGTPMEWGEWEPTRIIRTEPPKQAHEATTP